jgi:hypothetical protein
MGAVLAWKANQISEQRRIIATIKDIGGLVYYTHENPVLYMKNGKPDDPPGPAWIRRILGDDFFAEVEEVSLQPAWESTTNETVALVAQLPTVRWVQINSSVVDDNGLKPLRTLTRLTSVDIKSPMVTDKGVEELSRIPTLSSLELGCPRITGASLPCIKRMTGLRRLTICGVNFSEAERKVWYREMPQVGITWFGRYGDESGCLR